MKLFKKTLQLIAVLLLTQSATANNLQITNISLANDSTLSFNVSWDNSWRVSTPPYNHDAVWVFVKIKDCASGQWNHIDLSSVESQHTASNPLEIYIDGKDVASNAKGVFLRRSSDGVGNINNATVTLRMKNVPQGQFDFRIMGIEMVEVPSGSFYVGDGTSTGRLTDGNTSNPYLVDSEDAINVSATQGNLYHSSTTYLPTPLPVDFPKGFDGFYCMKYEISQGQYVDFVNMLTSDQAATRKISGTTNRLNITGAWPNLTANAPHRAINFLAWSDLLAYLDWSALRPMTELEYEKACRGTANPVSGEFAWGSSVITDANSLANDGTATEASTTSITLGGGVANFNASSILGPIRCGFAAKVSSSRKESGAGYYGIMEMSGNVWEQTIGLRGSSAVGFDGEVGDGQLSIVPNPGYADQSTWPQRTLSTSSTSGATARSFKGGSWADQTGRLRISDRQSINGQDGRRQNTYGGRGVR